MEPSKLERIKPKIIKIYELDDFEKLLNGVKVASCMLTESHNVVDETSVMKRLSALTLSGSSDGNCCSCCGVGPFNSRAEQTAHYKLHWHTYNLKRKLFGKSPLSLGQFNSRHDDDSSVSGSESENEDTNKSSNSPSSDLFAAATRHCKTFFCNSKGQVFSIYRCILHHRKEEISSDGNGATWVERVKQIAVPGFQRWAVFMVSGGHFAAAVFSGGVPAVHKTLHTYTTRKGQGQAQATRDQHGNAPKSAGANLRRYNQTQFLEQIQGVLSSWAEDLKGCWLILYRAIGPINQAALFGKNSPLRKDDSRVRALPFPTRKPTYKEVQRVHGTVSSVEMYETMEKFQAALMASTANKTNSDTNFESKRKQQKNISNKLDRAKSRQRVPRELPTQVTSSEDEGPCYIDSETPRGWIKTLEEQASKGVITNSRRDLLKISNSAEHSEGTDTDDSDEEDRKEISSVRRKKKKKPEEKVSSRKLPQKICASVKKMWKVISGNELSSLETILECWESSDLEAACNTQDPVDGNTALHKAAIAAKPDMVTQILMAGGNPCIRNHQLQTPYAASPHQDIRVAFRLFQAQHPDKYNYAKSQIPGPLTLEQLEQEKEKKTQQKRAKRQRERDKQVEKNKITKFLQLTDMQKIAANEKRCFLCGSPLSKCPFSYQSFEFCSIACLQNHRSIRPLLMST